jgi:predicted RNase H-like HicB family nuclease
MFNGTIQVNFYSEKNGFIAKCEPLNLVTQGDTLQEAADMFDEAIKILFEDLIENDNLENYLVSMGWDVTDNKVITPRLEGSRYIDLNEIADKVNG